MGPKQAPNGPQIKWIPNKMGPKWDPNKMGPKWAPKNGPPKTWAGPLITWISAGTNFLPIHLNFWRPDLA